MSKYIVERGDSLWNISKKLLGNAQKYEDIQAINNLTNDTIYAGQQLDIPNKSKQKTPLKLKEIPTNNQIHIIDNYSPKFNYIVEDNKIYYSRKDRDYWVDISENTYARKN